MSKILQQIADLILPTTPTEFWTLVAGLTGVVVLSIAFRGLKSLELTRKSLELARTDMLTRAKRDARQNAMDRALEWADQILAANAVILTATAQHKVPVFVSKPAEVRFDPDNDSHVKAARQWLAALPGDLYEKSIRMMNRIEAWSMHYTCGLADAEVVFGACAPTFCGIVVQNYAVLLVMRADAASGNYPNTIALFKQWLHLLEEQKRGLQQGELLARLRELQAQGPANPNLLPRPIGTDLDEG